MKKIKHQSRKNGSWKLIIIGGVFVFFILLWSFLIGFSSNQPGKFFNKQHNAIWIGHEWVDENKSDAEVQELVLNLEKHQIDTVFVHAGPFNEDGNIDPQTYPYATNFIEVAKKFAPQISFQAWLGQLRNKLPLEKEEVRHNIAKQTMILTQLVGFDGIHFDVEPVWDDDKDFIKVLKESRDIVPDDKIISVALAEFIPGSLIWMLEKVHKFENYNSEINYENVARYADQVVIMAYDTGINKGWLYRWLVKEQTIWLTRLLEGKELFVGIPAYDEIKEGFNPEVENIENGLAGIISGLNNFRSKEGNFAGVAIYSYWEMDGREWKSYDNLWLK